MTGSALETVLRRDRLVVAGALGVIVALTWGNHGAGERAMESDRSRSCSRCRR